MVLVVETKLLKATKSQPERVKAKLLSYSGVYPWEKLRTPEDNHVRAATRLVQRVYDFSRFYYEGAQKELLPNKNYRYLHVFTENTWKEEG